MKILFCTDGSKISYNAVKNFSQIFNDISADIISVSDMTYIPDNVLVHAEKYFHQCSSSVNSIIDYSVEYLENLDIKVDKKIKMCGNSVDLILNCESQNNYDYIVMGSNGKRGLQKWLGSVSQEVASNSKTSVYISKTSQNIQNILFPVNFSYILNDNLKRLISAMNFTDKNVYLLNVFDIPEFLFLEGNIDSNWASDIEMKQIKEGTKLLNSAEMLFVNNGISQVKKSIKKGNTSVQILKYIIKNSVSLAVMGMKSRKAKPDFISSSVSRRVLENTSCDMLIVKN